MPDAAYTALTIERHERAIFGGNGEGLGLSARMRAVEDFIDEVRAERKEARQDRHKILVAVVSAGLINLLGIVGTLLVTHPDLLAGH